MGGEGRDTEIEGPRITHLGIHTLVQEKGEGTNQHKDTNNGVRSRTVETLH